MTQNEQNKNSRAVVPQNKKQDNVDFSDLAKALEGLSLDNIQLATMLQVDFPIYYDESKMFWMWNHNLKCWKRVDKIDILNQMYRISDMNVVESTFKNEFIEAIRITGRERKVKPVEKTWLHFNNTFYDLNTGDTLEPTPDYFFTTPMPHNIGETEHTPTIDQLFGSWVSNPVDLVELSAYCMLDDYPIHRIFFLFGPGGNGKGQFMEFLTRLVGINNRTTTALDTIIQSRFEAARLFKKKLALIGETNYSKLENTDKLKKITGQDALQGEFKYHDPFEFYNSAKVIISSNAIPETKDKTTGFYRRCVIIEFGNQYDDMGKSVVDTIPEWEYENFIKKAIRVLRELLERGRFINEGSTVEKAEKYERLSNPFQEWQKELVEHVDNITPVWFLRKEYETFLKDHGHRGMVSEKEFTRRLKDAGYEVKRKVFGSHKWSAVFGLKSSKRDFVYIENCKVSGSEDMNQQYETGSHILYSTMPKKTARQDEL